jgi:hypothetical protein
MIPSAEFGCDEFLPRGIIPEKPDIEPITK